MVDAAAEGGQPLAGQTYDERGPVPPLAGLVSTVWVQRVAADAAPYTHRTVPNGSVELRCRIGSTPQVVGPLTRPLVEVLEPGTTVVGIRFRPGAAAAVFGLPASELVDQTVEGDELLGRAPGWCESGSTRLAATSTAGRALRCVSTSSEPA